MRKMASKTPRKPIPRPKNKFQARIYNLVNERAFEIGVMVAILLNMFVMAIEHYKMEENLHNILDFVNNGFIAIFSAEVILKLIGLRWYYFSVPWHVFDLIVIVISIVASTLSDFISHIVQPTIFRIVRLFRVTRVLRLIREAKGIRTLLFALMMSLPALINIGSLLLLVIFIYAIIGMSQFAYVQHIGSIDSMLNFETFPNSFLVLFQASTSEDWNKFLEPILLNKPPLCDPHVINDNPMGKGNCGDPGVGKLYFSSFILITWLVVINMYIAIILENFDVATRENAEPLTADDFEQFFEVWQKYDDKLTQLISYEELQLLLHQLDEPLHVPLPNRPFITHYQMAMTCDGKIHCLEVIIALIKKVLGDSIALDAMKQAMITTFQLKCKTTVRYSAFKK